jgi:DNA repair exonuclease SbcCD ATPase subunit
MSELINLKVKSDFEQASADLKKFGQVSEAEAKRIQKFAESFKTEQIERFMEKQERSAVAMTATRGKVEALSTEHRNLQREIERLINKGLDPQDAALQPLITKYSSLTNELETTKRKTEELRVKTEQNKIAMDNFSQKSIEFAKRALIGLAVAAGAALVAVGKMSIDLAKQGDDLSMNAAQVGLTTKAYQELSYAAELSDVSSESMKKGLQRLNISVSDLQMGSGKLTTVLKEINPEMINQLKTVQSTEEAFNLTITAIQNAGDQFEKASIAEAAFGKAGKEIVLMANDGVEGIDKLRTEVQKYGIMSEETIAKAEEFDDSQKRLTATIEGLKIKLFSGMIPGITQAADGFQKWISTGNNLENTLKTIGYVLIGAASGLTAFMIVAKGAVILETLTVAFRTLTAAIASNPIGAIAVVISAIAVPAMIALFNQTDRVTALHKDLDAQTEKLKTTFSDYADIQKKLNDKTVSLTESERVLLELRKEQLANEMVANLEKEIKTIGSLTGEISKQEKKVADTAKRYEEVAAIKREIETLEKEALQTGKNQIIINEQIAAYEKRLKEVNANLMDVTTTQAKQNASLQAAKITRQETIDQLAEAVNLHYLDIGMIKMSNKSLGDEIAIRAKVLEKQKEEIEKKGAGIKLTGEDLEEREKANARILEIANGYKEQIEDMNATKERLIELEYERKKAEIETSDASIDAQKEAIAWARKLADEKLKALKEVPAPGSKGDIKDLTARLNAEKDIEQKAFDARISTFQTFLKTRMDMEGIATQGRAAWLDQELKTIQGRTDLSNDEKLAAEKAVRDMALDIYKGELSEKDKLRLDESAKLEAENQKRINDLKETLAKNLDEFNKYSSALAELIGGITNLFIAGNQAKLEDARLTNEQLTTGEIAYQNMLAAQKQQEIENNKNNLAQLQQDYLAELDVEKKADIQKQIDTLQAQIGLDAARTRAEEERAAKDAEFKKQERKLIRENAIASRVAAVADVAAKTGQAIAAAWVANITGFGLPWSAFAAGMGILQTAAILTPPLPAAQTGTISSGSQIPETGSARGRLDRIGVMASPGETVHVLPKGQDRKQQRFIFQVEKKVIFDIVNEGIEGGDVHINYDNIQGVISA